MSDQPPVHRLDYAPGRPPRKWLRRLVMAIVAASVIGTGLKYWPAVRDRAVVLYWQRQCMNFQPPGPDTVVLGDVRPGDVVPQPPRGYISLHTSPAYFILPGMVVTGPYTYGDAVCCAPICWGHFVEATSLYPYSNQPDAIVFLHSRRNPCGLERLVAVGRWDDPQENSTLVASIVVPGDAGHLPKLQGGGVDDQLQGIRQEFWGEGFNTRKIFAGTVDPADESRFTIEFEWLDGVRGVIDGQLLDTGHVNLTIRPGPGDYDSYNKRMQDRAATQPAN